MNRNLALLALTVLLAAPFNLVLGADEPNPAEVQMRERLKATMLQLRQAQNDLATAQATQAEDEQKISDLTSQNQTLTKQAITDKEASDQALADLNKKNAAQAAQIAAYKEALGKWEAGYKLAATTAKDKEAERAKLNSENIILQRRVDDLTTRNTNLFQIGNEILTRYEKFGLGEALAAKEPFVGTTRVKLENQVQGYEDKLLNQKNNPNNNGQTPSNDASVGQGQKQANQQTAESTPQSSHPTSNQ